MFAFFFVHNCYTSFSLSEVTSFIIIIFVSLLIRSVDKMLSGCFFLFNRLMFQNGPFEEKEEITNHIEQEVGAPI